MGDRLPDRLDAEGQCRLAAAGGRRRSRCAAAYPPEDTLDEADLAAAKWCWREQPAGRPRRGYLARRKAAVPADAHRPRPGRRRRAGQRPAGPAAHAGSAAPVQRAADQAALAIERIGLAEDRRQARLAAETERLRSALLTSISHDLRTPLASILGSATSLQELSASPRRGRAGGADRDDPGGGRAAQPLHRQHARYDPARSRGPSQPKPIWSISAMSSAARWSGRARCWPSIASVVDLAADLPMLKLDPVLFEQVLFNLLDNAAKYAPAGSRSALRRGATGTDGASCR